MSFRVRKSASAANSTAHFGRRVGDVDIAPKRSAPRKHVPLQVIATGMLCLQSAVALLIGLRVVPLEFGPGVTDEVNRLAIAGFFLLLACPTALLLLRKRAEEQSYSALLQHAFHDPETTLPNRAAVELVLDDWLNEGHPCSCICIEMAALGPATSAAPGADSLLQSIAKCLQDLAEPGTMLGRLSHDRFVMLLGTNHSKPELAAKAEKIVSTLAVCQSFDARPVTAGISVGIATATADDTDRIALLAEAKQALVVARADDKQHFCFAEDMRNTDRSRSTVIFGKLQKALVHGALQLVYQPIFSSAGDMVAAEALARWHDTEEGQIAPAEFVPVAEATGLIVPLSNWVLRNACTQMSTWRTMGVAMQRIAVNVSVKQVCRTDFISTVMHILQDTHLPASCLELEVTEGALASDFEAVNRNLQTLRRAGVRISIDDFGTGYSSLSRVRELNADVLKIDRLFTQGATESKGGAAMVQAIIDMAHNLQLSVLAEGIERGSR